MLFVILIYSMRTKEIYCGFNLIYRGECWLTPQPVLYRISVNLTFTILNFFHTINIIFRTNYKRNFFNSIMKFVYLRFENAKANTR